IPGFALADLALAGLLRWPHVAVAVLFFAYAAIDLTLAINFWSAAVGALAVAGYLALERMAVRPDPIPLGELQWSGPRPRRVMLHPDGQYDPAIIPNLCQVIESGEADIVLGSRWLGLDPAKAGMPWWKRLGNRFLTTSENQVLGLHLSEYHTGYRAYSRRFLEAIPFLENSNDF